MTQKSTKRDPSVVATRRKRPLTKQPKQPKLTTSIPPANIKLTPELLEMMNKPD